MYDKILVSAMGLIGLSFMVLVSYVNSMLIK